MAPRRASAASRSGTVCVGDAVATAAPRLSCLRLEHVPDHRNEDWDTHERVGSAWTMPCSRSIDDPIIAALTAHGMVTATELADLPRTTDDHGPRAGKVAYDQFA
jgi:hypothetical protein